MAFRPRPGSGCWSPAEDRRLGLNWQHCHRMTFFPSHGLRAVHQAVRRSWRFGPTDIRSTVDPITTARSRVLDNLQRKAAQADDMFDHPITHQRRLTAGAQSYAPRPVEVPTWMTNN